jgi:hypothetical protein|tara:strand:- start:8756 stop:8911 length:156 start_codon:yes stop_codon:yes gene_type:complete
VLKSTGGGGFKGLAEKWFRGFLDCWMEMKGTRRLKAAPASRARGMFNESTT